MAHVFGGMFGLGSVQALEELFRIVVVPQSRARLPGASGKSPGPRQTLPIAPKMFSQNIQEGLVSPQMDWETCSGHRGEWVGERTNTQPTDPAPPGGLSW